MIENKPHDGTARYAIYSDDKGTITTEPKLKDEGVHSVAVIDHRNVNNPTYEEVENGNKTSTGSTNGNTNVIVPYGQLGHSRSQTQQQTEKEVQYQVITIKYYTQCYGTNSVT